MVTKEYRLVGDVLRLRREELGLKQRDVAERLGHPQSYVSKVETGSRLLGLVDFLAFADALDTAPETLLTRIRDELDHCADNVRQVDYQAWIDPSIDDGDWLVR